MNNYYVNNVEQPNGDHEVHKDNCMFLPNNKTWLGLYSNCQEALKAAKKIYSKSDGCYYCSKECHSK